MSTKFVPGVYWTTEVSLANAARQQPVCVASSTQCDAVRAQPFVSRAMTISSYNSPICVFASGNAYGGAVIVPRSIVWVPLSSSAWMDEIREGSAGVTTTLDAGLLVSHAVPGLDPS